MEIPNVVVSSRGISTLSREERKEYAILNEEEEDDDGAVCTATSVNTNAGFAIKNENEDSSTKAKVMNDNECTASTKAGDGREKLIDNYKVITTKNENEDDNIRYERSSSSSQIKQEPVKDEKNDNSITSNSSNNSSNNDNKNIEEEEYYDSSDDEAVERRMHNNNNNNNNNKRANTAAGMNGKEKEKGKTIDNNKVATVNNRNDDDDNKKEGSKNQPIPSNSEYIPQPIDPPNSCNNMISIGNRLLKNRMEHANPSIIEICTTMKRICDNNASKNRIFVSLGCGTAATEINSNEICLCLDTDRRSLFNACIDLKQRKKKTIWMSFFDYSNESLKDLLEQLKETTKKRISVLYQHPSPSANISYMFSLSCSYVATSLLAGHVKDVCMVYDHKTTGNSWNEQTITKAFFERIAPDKKALIKLSKMALICASDSDTVYHPYFGSTKRHGLVEVKKGEECRIFFSKKENKKEKEEKKEKNNVTPAHGRKEK